MVQYSVLSQSPCTCCSALCGNLFFFCQVCAYWALRFKLFYFIRKGFPHIVDKVKLSYSKLPVTMNLFIALTPVWIVNLVEWLFILISFCIIHGYKNKHLFLSIFGSSLLDMIKRLMLFIRHRISIFRST